MENNTDIKLSGAPNDKYQKFFDKFKEIDSLDVASWNGTHLIGYFCKKYKQYYNTDYKFKFNNPLPSKSFEVFQIKKLSINLTSKPILLKSYIDWIFENKVPQAKRKLTSISFLTSEDTLTFYKMNVLFENKMISRSSSLPEEYKEILSKASYPINTYGDLAFLSQMSDMSNELINAFNDIKAIGFDIELLKKII